MPGAKKYSILVCVHPESANGLLYSVLSGPTFYVETVQSYSECLRRINTGKFNALVIDAFFFKKKNIVISNLIQELVTLLPVIVIAEKEDLENESRIREHKIFYYLPKPVDQKELSEVLNQSVRWSQTSQEYEEYRLKRDVPKKP